MVNEYLGKEIDIAGPDHIGDTSSHIEVIIALTPNDPCSAYFRSNFNQGNGPVSRSSLREEDIYRRRLEENPRGWRDTKTIFSGKKTLEADEIALTEAKKRKVVLYKTTYEPRYNTVVVLCPDNWRPAGDL